MKSPRFYSSPESQCTATLPNGEIHYIRFEFPSNSKFHFYDARTGESFKEPCEQTRAPYPARLAAAVTLGKKGGLVRSKAKSAAARANGKKGGRPRLKPLT